MPIRKSSTIRGETLRKILNIDKDNPLSDRTLRNHFEHYDERIEYWFENNQSAVYTDFIIDPFDSKWKSKASNHHRAYNPITKVLTFRGESLNLGNILDALEKIQHKCRNFVLV